MAKVSLSQMNVESLIELGDQVDQRLREHRVERIAYGRRAGSALRGRKVPPKCRSSSGETWAGRGAKPRWLVAAIKGGKKLDDFLIVKSVRKEQKKRRSKR